MAKPAFSKLVGRVRVPDAPKVGVKQMHEKRFKATEEVDNKLCIHKSSDNNKRVMQIDKKTGSVKVLNLPQPKNSHCNFCSNELKGYERTKLMKCGHRAHENCYRQAKEQQENVRPTSVNRTPNINNCPPPF